LKPRALFIQPEIPELSKQRKMVCYFLGKFLKNQRIVSCLKYNNKPKISEIRGARSYGTEILGNLAIP